MQAVISVKNIFKIYKMGSQTLAALNDVSMDVSVTERTREIGIRMAVGATGIDVQFQLLLEAVVLSLIGGISGILLGLGTSYLVSSFAGFTTIVTIKSIIISFVVSTLIGVFFGWYPSRKAANLNPIDALRYE